eukprot:405302_1
MMLQIYGIILTIITFLHHGIGCEYEGYSISDRSHETCLSVVVACSSGNERWIDQNCGRGCKPECVNYGWSHAGYPPKCSSTSIECDTGTEYWEDASCGCGCKPINTENGNIINKNIEDDG